MIRKILLIVFFVSVQCGVTVTTNGNGQCALKGGKIPHKCILKTENCKIYFGDCVGDSCIQVAKNVPVEDDPSCGCTSNSQCPAAKKKKSPCYTKTTSYTCKNGDCIPTTTRKNHPKGSTCAISAKSTECKSYAGQCNGKGTCETVASNIKEGKLCGGSKMPTTECGGTYKVCKSGTCTSVKKTNTGKYCNKSTKPGECGGTFYMCNDKFSCVKYTNFTRPGTVCGGTKKTIGVCGGKWKECDGKGKCAEKKELKTSCGTTVKSECSTVSYVCSGLTCKKRTEYKVNGTLCNGSKLPTAECGGLYYECQSGKCVSKDTRKPKGKFCNGTTKRPTNDCGGEWNACDGNGACVRNENYVEKGAFCAGSTKIPASICGGKYSVCNGKGTCESKRNYKDKGFVCEGTAKNCGKWKECDGAGACVDKTREDNCNSTVIREECRTTTWVRENYCCKKIVTNVSRGALCKGSKKATSDCGGEWYECDGNGACLKKGEKKPVGTACDGTAKSKELCGGDWKQCDADGNCVFASNKKKTGELCGNVTRKPTNECGGSYSVCSSNGECSKTNNLKPQGTLCANSIKPTSACGGVYYVCNNGTCVKTDNFAKNGTLCGGSKYTSECGTSSYKVCDGIGQCIEVKSNYVDGKPCNNSLTVDKLPECGGTYNICESGKCVVKSKFTAKNTLCNGARKPTGECGGAWHACDGAGECRHYAHYKNTTCGNTTKPTGFCGGTWKQCEKGVCVVKNNQKTDGVVCSDKTVIDEGCGGSRNICKAGKCIVETNFKRAGEPCGNNTTTSQSNECGVVMKICNGKGKCITSNTIKPVGTLCNNSTKKAKECGSSWYECDGNTNCVQRNSYLVAGTLCGNSTAKPSNKCGGRWSECDGKGTCVKKHNFLPEGKSCGNSNITDPVCGSTLLTCDGKGICRSTTKRAKKGTLCGNTSKPAEFCGGVFKQCDGKGYCVTVQNYKTNGTDCSDSKDTKLDSKDSSNSTKSMCSVPGRMCDGKGKCVSTSTHKADGTLCKTAEANECYTINYECRSGKCNGSKRMKSYGTFCGGFTAKPEGECGSEYKICDGNGACTKVTDYAKEGTACGKTTNSSTHVCYSTHRTCKSGKCVGEDVPKMKGSICGEISKRLCTEVIPTCDGTGLCVNVFHNFTDNTKCGESKGDPNSKCGGTYRTCSNGQCIQKSTIKPRGTLCGNSTKKEIKDCQIVWDECDGNGQCTHKTSKRLEGTLCRGSVKPSGECGGSWHECDTSGVCVERTNLKNHGVVCGNTTRPTLSNYPCGGAWNECDGQGRCVPRNSFLEVGTSCGFVKANVSDCTQVAKICNGKGECLERSRKKEDGESCGIDTVTTQCSTIKSVCLNGVCIQKKYKKEPGTFCGDPFTSECSSVKYECDELGECVTKSTNKQKGISCGTIEPQANICKSIRSQCDGEGHCLHISENAPNGTLCGSDENNLGDIECGESRNVCMSGRCVKVREFAAKGTVCRVSKVATSACGTNHGECDGMGICETVKTYSPAGTFCGPLSEKACSTEVSVCDGKGTCMKTKTLNKEEGALCGDDVEYPCKTIRLQCDALGYCSEKVIFKAHGLSCGNRTTHECGITEDICNGNGTCITNTVFHKTDVVCRASVSECDLPERCNGTSVECPQDLVLPVGSDCGKPEVNDCTLIEGKCDKSGMCVTSNSILPDKTPCGNAAACGYSQCVGGVCVVFPKEAGSVCAGGDELTDSSVSGDNACLETAFCDGVSVTCPDVKYRPSTHVCRPAKGLCDVEEYCTGSSPDCPKDVFKSRGVVCREKKGACDIEEKCSGTKPDCPPDNVKEEGTICRPSKGICDVEEVCDGKSKECPEDAKVRAGTVCRPQRFEYCDAPSVCNGMDDECALPSFQITACGPKGEGLCESLGKCSLYEKKAVGQYERDECVDDSQCNDHNPCTIDKCSNDLKCTHTPGNAGAVCGRALYEECDSDAICNGHSAICPESAFLPSQKCGLNNEGTCKSKGKCVVDAPVPAFSCNENSQCDDGNPCTVDKCVNGKCENTPGNKGTLCRKRVYADCDSETFCDGEASDCPDTEYTPKDEECGVEGVGKCKGRGDCLSEAKLPSYVQKCGDDEDCDDGNPCTVDKCYEGQFCIHTPGNKGTECRKAQYTSCDSPDVCDGVNADCPTNSTYVAKFEPCSLDKTHVCVGRGDCEEILDDDDWEMIQKARQENEEDGKEDGKEEEDSDSYDQDDLLIGQLSPGKPLSHKTTNSTSCFGDEHCDDLLPCTVDTCVDGKCKHVPGNKGYFCGKPRFDVCDSADVCDGVNTYCPVSVFEKGLQRCGVNGVCTERGKCTERDPDETEKEVLCNNDSQCDDDNPCTIDKCSKLHYCVHTPGNAGSICRAKDPARICDVEEFCDGVSSECPPESVDRLCLEQHELLSTTTSSDDDDELLTKHVQNNPILNSADVLKEIPTDNPEDPGAPVSTIDDNEYDDFFDGPETDPNAAPIDTHYGQPKTPESQNKTVSTAYQIEEEPEGLTATELGVIIGIVVATIGIIVVTLLIMRQKNKRTEQRKVESYVAM